MKNFDIISIGGAVRDITFFTSEGKVFDTPENLTAQKMLAFEYGAKLDIKNVFYNLGGGAANTSVSLSRLGLKAGVIVRVGQDQDGDNVIDKFNKEKVITDLVQRDRNMPTGISFLLATSKKDREHVIFLSRGANNKLIFDTKVMSKISTKWFYISSISGKDHLSTLNKFFDYASKKNIKIAWNPGKLQLKAGRKALASMLEKTHTLILNKDEAIELVLSGIKLGRKNPSFLNRPVYLVNILSDWGPKNVVITENIKGVCVYDGKTIFKQKPKKAKPADTTGVGDAFGSAYIAGYIHSKGDIEKSLKWGVNNAASVVKKVGAQNGLLKLKDLKK